MIPRTLESKLHELAGYYPVVLVTGPRQSGKTTLCQMAYPDKRYVSLEALDIRDFASGDPRGFLAGYADGAIIDEIQNVPELLNYLQTEIDIRPDPGRFILTGSQHFGLSQSIAQTLAGRCGILVLLPPSLQELCAFPTAPTDLLPLLWQGAYPRIYDRDIPAHQWLTDYTTTYIQRDVRQVINVSDLQAFSGFLKLCAGRTAQEINLSALGNDAGVSHNTARAWLSVLKPATSSIAYRHGTLTSASRSSKVPSCIFLTAVWHVTYWVSENQSNFAYTLCAAQFSKARSSPKSTRPAYTTACSPVCFTIGKPADLKSICLSCRAMNLLPSKLNRAPQRLRIFSKTSSVSRIA